MANRDSDSVCGGPGGTRPQLGADTAPNNLVLSLRQIHQKVASPNSARSITNSLRVLALAQPSLTLNTLSRRLGPTECCVDFFPSFHQDFEEFFNNPPHFTVNVHLASEIGFLTMGGEKRFASHRRGGPVYT